MFNQLLNIILLHTKPECYIKLLECNNLLFNLQNQTDRHNYKNCYLTADTHDIKMFFIESKCYRIYLNGYYKRELIIVYYFTGRAYNVIGIFIINRDFDNIKVFNASINLSGISDEIIWEINEYKLKYKDLEYVYECCRDIDIVFYSSPIKYFKQINIVSEKKYKGVYYFKEINRREIKKKIIYNNRLYIPFKIDLTKKYPIKLKK